ncbi:MAG: twin-arginine translocase TatA/TatE family subunit, partial [Solirubrobacteraceae bacterium]
MIGDILQPTHLLFVLVVALLVLGPKRLPEASRAIGKGIRDFRMEVTGEEPDHGAISSPPMPAGVTAPYAPVATPAPPPSEATFPAFAAEPAVTALEGADTVASAATAPEGADTVASAVTAPEAADTVARAATAPEGADTVASAPEAAPTNQPTEPAQP